ncbi:rubredoxin-NAD reductase, putative [Pediculus humanus corporis]|uniref:Rubredoxin-NAD reductase, putative n=1 Tax=Pediculus humanus subsp. corporis TaxID=121224 RepID=E0VMM3_PEDHC|nr:rubredoxin-NAD reductase, putative [Pediculus humanus corporis]EEB14629.1 rubredoxin-NAD reductase, putative [Pediculus humanus corporis]
MGSSISKGRKYSPTKSVTRKNPNPFLEQATFSCSDSTVPRSEIIEEIVCQENEIEENGMKVVDVGGEDGGKVLLVKQNGKISALGTKCTHYGAPLVNGVLGDGRVRCQWHGACFNIANGDIEDFPGLDSLPCYEVEVSEEGNVKVRADKQLLQANKRVKPFVRTLKAKTLTFMVAGGGAAGANCVETLRQEGFEGRIIFVIGENYLPYDRIKISKSLDVDAEKILLRSAEFYRERNIELMMNTQLTELNPRGKLATLSNGQQIQYDKIFLATGSTPRKLCTTGSHLKNIFVIRTIDDGKEIMKVLTKDSKVVILGTSFIGMEAAAFCSGKAKSVVVVGRNKPFKMSLGEVIGDRVMRLFEDNKVTFRLNQTIEKFEGENGTLTGIELSDGSKLECDICIIGIGVTSNTDYLKPETMKLGKNNAIDVNEYLQSQYSDVYAGGDIAIAPVLGQKANIGHWGLANYHGHIAALNMLEKKKPLNAVPFFWTMLYGKGFRYAGYASSYDDVVIDGNVEDFKFIAFYCSGNNVLAVTTIGRDPLAAKFAEMLYEGKKLSKNKIQNWLK